MALALLVVVSMLAGPLSAAAMAASTTAGNQPSDGGASAAPPGWAGPPERVVDRVPADARSAFGGVSATDLRGRTAVSAHASTTSIAVEVVRGARGEPRFALNVTDDTVTDGRRVAVPASVLRQALGDVPEVATVRHSSGEVYTVRLTRDGAGRVRIPFRHFSSNTVTFGGTVNITGSPATDGSKYSYEVQDLDAVNNFSTRITGTVAKQTETESATLEGGSASISVAGNVAPEGPAVDSSPEVEVTAYQTSDDTPYNGDNSGSQHIVGTDGNGNLIESEQKIGESVGTFNHLYFANAGGSDYTNSDVKADVYAVRENPDGTYGEGTLIKSGWQPSSDGRGFSTQKFDGQGGPVTIEVVTTAGSGTSNYIYQRPDPGPVSGTWTTSTSASDSGSADVRVTGNIGSPTVDADDGTSKSLGSMSGGETKTAPLNVTTDATSLSVSGGAGRYDLSLSYTERTETADPCVEVNGNSECYSGPLTNGSSVDLTTNESWIVEGTNTVNVSVGAGSLSADAPTPAVGLAYEHETVDDKVVDYESETWSERYNVSKTYASDRVDATLTIPHADEVVSVRSVEMRVNGGSWSSVSSSDYTLDGTTLTVQIGDVAGGDEVEVRTAASKVVVNNGAISVLEATSPGSRLDTEFMIESWSSDSYIAVGGTTNGNRVHYTYDESWSADENALVDADGNQHLRLPNAASGSIARASMIPVGVSPDTGDVTVEVENPSTTEPEFIVSPGSAKGDDVAFTFIAAADGEDYVLYSETNEIVRDSGTASSPLTLSDDDSGETLAFLLDDSGGSSSGGGGGTLSGSVAVGGATSAGVDDGLFVILAAGAVAAVWFLTREFSSGGAAFSARTLVIVEAGLVGILALETLSPASLIAGVAQGVSNLLGGVGDGLAQAMPLVILAAGALGVLYLRNRGKPSKVVNFRLGRRGK